MKNDFLWTKTLLSVYKYLERISGAIDKIIMRRALNCTSLSAQNYFQNNAFAVSQKLIDLSERKITLINLKILIEDTLSEIDCEDAQILIEKYFDGVKSKELAEKYDISMRTVFRRIEGAMNSFSKCLSAKGYGDAKLSNMVADEKWIENVYQRYAEKNEDDLTLSNAFLEKAASM